MKFTLIFLTLSFIACTSEEPRQKKETKEHDKASSDDSDVAESDTTGLKSEYFQGHVQPDLTLEAIYYTGDDLSLDTFQVSPNKMETYNLKGFNYPQIHGITSPNNRQYLFVNDTCKLLISTSKFNRNEHKILTESGNDNNPIRIDGQAPWGAFGLMPRRQIDSIGFIVNDSSILIPHDAYSDLYEPNVKCQGGDCYTSLFATPFGHILWMQNSDGAGGYNALLFFKSYQYVGRHVSLGF